ncbi:alpha/beta hydrolase [Rhodococcus sp. APC 3903]|uniref:alpha/beta fold hydrolase n=1 Tax=Rhodococcus sp. APC 3903 TaxID=3035193 RepID=UPI0025B513CB|nr:alpha/beta hydrolase [Rhodococcus sp. APC 3903]MDN3460863.1 alpha/beta hydrolase [Rhodococcus sp. APC 3903]
MSETEISYAPRRVAVGEITMSVIDEGHGPAVLLLHGFPDRALMWRHQIQDLVAAGYRVIAPDLRGFGDSDRPTDLTSYSAPALLGDVLGLLDELDIDQVHVGAHDWGALLGWVLAGSAPDRVRSLAVFSVGHPRAFAGAGFEQKQLSWYILWWQSLGVAESQLPQQAWQWYRDWAYAGIDRYADQDLDRQLTDLERPGALTAGLSWYRANLTPAEFAESDWVALADLPAITCPVLGVWGDREMALTERQMTDSARYVSGPWRYERITRVGHWIPAHAPERASQLLLDHFGSAENTIG